MWSELLHYTQLYLLGLGTGLLIAGMIELHHVRTTMLEVLAKWEKK